MAREKTAHVQFKVTPQERADLDELCRLAGRSVAGQVVFMVKRELAKHRREAKRLAPEA